MLPVRDLDIFSSCIATIEVMCDSERLNLVPYVLHYSNK
jgi:hypothetical protein